MRLLHKVVFTKIFHLLYFLTIKRILNNCFYVME